MKKAVIGVGIAGYPVSAAGNTWAFLQWVLGFQKLGWDVWVVEGIESAKCIDENYKEGCPFEQSANKSHWKKITGEFGFKNSLFIDGKTENEKDLKLFARDAEIFLNISGHFKELEIVRDIPHRIYLDLDPAFTQIWAQAYDCDMNFQGHNWFFSVGSRMENARIPETGHQWLPTLPPVDLDYWKPQSAKKQKSENYWTTVTHWYGYPDVKWNGISYSGKGAEFEKMISLPQKTNAKLMIATDLDSTNKIRKNFEKAGWKITSGPAISKNWKDYRDFVGASRGECCVAKGGYVVSKCGWFSDRSACYLATGRPVVLQETGWSSILGGKEGLLPFTDLESAAAALDKIESDYEKHSLAARKLAEEKLDNKKVVAAMLEKISQKD